MKAWAWLVAVGMMAVAVAGIAWVPVGAHHASAPFYDGTVIHVVIGKVTPS